MFIQNNVIGSRNKDYNFSQFVLSRDISEYISPLQLTAENFEQELGITIDDYLEVRKSQPYFLCKQINPDPGTEQKYYIMTGILGAAFSEMNELSTTVYISDSFEKVLSMPNRTIFLGIKINFDTSLNLLPSSNITVLLQENQ